MSHEGVGAPGGVDEGGQMSDLDGVDSLVELLQYRGKYLRSQLNEESSTRTKQYNSGHLALYEACRDVASYMDSDTIREEEVLQVVGREYLYPSRGRNLKAGSTNPPINAYE